MNNLIWLTSFSSDSQVDREDGDGNGDESGEMHLAGSGVDAGIRVVVKLQRMSMLYEEDG
jgi:hypothetical protein